MFSFLSVKTCVDVILTTKEYGNENSWSLGPCKGHGGYTDYTTYRQECCLVPSNYSLECIDRYGDGWHGGYVEVQGTRYCENFGNTGKHEIIIEGKMNINKAIVVF